MNQESLFLLAELLKKPLESLEILPGGLKEWESQTSDGRPFVLLDGHLGIPQKVLYKLYMIALALYKSSTPDTLLALSSVILLANPAHQTVLNARKRLMSSGLLQPGDELNLTALFIGNSKDCAKQSIIWDHRRWIFRHRYERIRDGGPGLIVESPGWSTSEEASFYPMIPLGVLEKECELIRRACELYPRNYHAWVHYHWVLDVVAGGIAASAGKDLQDRVRFLRQEVAELREWIELHVSDYSAIHLLCSVTFLEHTGGPRLVENGEGSLAEELREHALNLVVSYPSHEALWLYLRHLLSSCTAEITRGFTDRLRRHEEVPLDMIEKYLV